MRIATWNINSIRARQERYEAWLVKADPDVLCLQELKCEDSKFPTEATEALGYTAATHGQKTYNGVALVSKEPVDNAVRGFGDGVDDPQARFIAAEVSGVTVCSAYFPNGSEMGSDKYEYKLQWLERLFAWVESNLDPAKPAILTGDFNIARDELDLLDVDRWTGGVLFNDHVRGYFQRLLDWGFVDVFREHHPKGGVYTWWDYRQLAFPKNNGLRIDYILATKGLAARCTKAWVDRDERKGKKPSDHAPVLAEFSV